MLYPESLFFVDNDQSQVGELNILGKQSMGSNGDIDSSLVNILEDRHLFFASFKPAQGFNAEWIISHSLTKSTSMLLCQYGCGYQDRNLFAVFNGLEGSTNCDLRFSEADITADESVHGLFRLRGVPGLATLAEQPGVLLLLVGLITLMGTALQCMVFCRKTDK